MTDIIELAKKCEASYIEQDNLGPEAYYFTIPQLQAFADAIRKEQIEKDAKICDGASLNEYPHDCAEEIRNQLVKQND